MYMNTIVTSIYIWNAYLQICNMFYLIIIIIFFI